MTVLSREFQVFVKPVGSACNLNCSYCYYLEKQRLYPGNYSILMPDEVLENYIIQHIEASTDELITFSWHGGEPLIAGIDFYKKVVKFQKRYKPVGSKIVNGLQTNGTLLNKEWCDFLASEGFFVGISIDGTENMHNRYRKTLNKEGSFSMVLRGFKLLQNSGILPEILCVVNSDNVKDPISVYNFFKNLGAEFITFLPLVIRKPDSLTGVCGKSVPAHEFGVFLSLIFDLWVEEDIGRVKIQIFEEAIRTAFNQEHTLCVFKENCGGVPVVEHNGDFYSCDHYVDKNHLLGNIINKPLSYFLDSEKQKSFGNAKSLTLPQYCKECDVLSMCNGECPKNRFILTPDGETGLNYLCSGYKHFFTHCRPFVDAIREVWKKQ